MTQEGSNLYVLGNLTITGRLFQPFRSNALVVFGSLVGFTAYVFLLRHTRPALVATYAYVNPVVAVLLGWALADEPLSARTLLAGAVIVGAVALITTHRQRPGAAAATEGKGSAVEAARPARRECIAASSASTAEP